jgi:hypothetical protein
MRELAIRTLCAGLDVIDAVTGKLPFMCAVFGHKWGTRTESDRITNRFHCERCGYSEITDNSEASLNAMNEAYRQCGMDAPVYTSEYHTAYFETLSN